MPGSDENHAPDDPSAPAPNRCAGILLTGGSSTRFGRDKAKAVLGGATLAARAGKTLAAVTAPTLEVGTGVSGLEWVPDDRLGPLAALARAVEALPRPLAPALVLACDIPLVTRSLLRWLVQHPAAGSVVPLAGDPPVPQPLCARWSPAVLRRFADLVAAGERSLRPLVEAPDVTLVPAADWRAAAAPAGDAALDDVDTQADFEAVRRRMT